jgi:hypothetical protein
MTIRAEVVEVQSGGLLVHELHKGGVDILVHTPCADSFHPGDWVCIEYSGAMTRSIPPQVTATRIVKIPSCGCP